MVETKKGESVTYTNRNNQNIPPFTSIQSPHQKNKLIIIKESGYIIGGEIRWNLIQNKLKQY